MQKLKVVDKEASEHAATAKKFIEKKALALLQTFGKLNALLSQQYSLVMLR